MQSQKNENKSENQLVDKCHSDIAHGVKNAVFPAPVKGFQSLKNEYE